MAAHPMQGRVHRCTQRLLTVPSRAQATAATNGYTPPPELEAFLAAGPAPVYIGFGSMTLPDAQASALAHAPLLVLW